jgi:hypothetical protein
MAQQHATHLHLAADGQGEGERGRWGTEEKNDVLSMATNKQGVEKGKIA